MGVHIGCREFWAAWGIICVGKGVLLVGSALSCARRSEFNIRKCMMWIRCLFRKFNFFY